MRVSSFLAGVFLLAAVPVHATTWSEVVIRVRTADRDAPETASASRAERIARARASTTRSEAGVRAALAEAAARGEATQVRGFWIDRLIAARVTDGVRRALAARADVEWVRDNTAIRMTRRREHVSHALQTPAWSPRAVAGVDQATALYGVTGAGVRVCVLDTGVDATHPDIAPRMVTRDPLDPTFPGGWASISSTGEVLPPSEPYDSEGHGTHVSGVVVAGDASGYTIGVAPGAGLMHALVLPGGEGRMAQVIGGMEWAADPDGDPLTDDAAHVVVMSLGVSDTLGAMVEPVRTLLSLGILPVAAMGNMPAALAAPANIPDVIGVGASDELDQVAAFSARGEVEWHHAPYEGIYQKPDLVAPGVNIYSTVPYGDWEWLRFDVPWSGTSEAAPFVGGVAALLREANPAIGVDSLRAILLRSAHDVDAPGPDVPSGAGRVDALAAVTEAYAGRPFVDGSVRDAVTGDPVPAAVVRVTGADGHVFLLRSDEEGRFTLRPDSTTIEVAASGFAHESTTVSVTLPLDVRTPVDVALTPLATTIVAARVQDRESRAPVPGHVDVLYAGLPVLSVDTDTGGGFAAALPLTTVTLRVIADAPHDTVTVPDVAIASGADTLRLLVPRAEALVVNAGDDIDYTPLYRAVFARTGRRVAFTAARPDSTRLRAYGTVVWFTGDATIGTFTQADQDAVRALLATGGRALVLGKGPGKETVVRPFLSEVLGTGAETTAPTPSGVESAPGDTVFAGFTATIVPHPGGPAERPTALTAIAPASLALAYTGGTAAGHGAGVALARDSVRTLTLGFGLEEMPDSTQGAGLLERALDWLAPPPSITHTPLTDTDVDDAPFAVDARIDPHVVPLDSASTRVVYDVNGGPPVVVPLVRVGTGDLFRAEIPPQPLGSRVAYSLEAGDVDGRLARAPFDPAIAFVFHVASDTIAPVIAHAPHDQTLDTAGPYVIDATASDEHGIASVTLRSRWSTGDGSWTSTPMQEIAPGQYRGEVPGPGAAGDTLFYTIDAQDGSRRANVSSAGPYTLRVVEALTWDMEDTGGAFTPSGGGWEWGTPAIGAHSGSRAWAIRLAGGYPADTTGTLAMPPVQIPASAAVATLRFSHAYEFDGLPPSLLEGGLVEVSIDGGATYQPIAPAGGYDGVVSRTIDAVGGLAAFGGSNLVWHDAAVPLTPFLGSEMRVRFTYGTQEAGGGRGWFLDDVRVTWATVDTVPPILARLVRPRATPDSLGPYLVTASIGDEEGSPARAIARYTTDGGVTFHDVSFFTSATPPSVSAFLPGQPRGTRVAWYAVASDATQPALERRIPAGDSLYAFAVMPAAPVIVLSVSPAAPALDDAVDAALSSGAEVWDAPRVGLPSLDALARYRVIWVDGAAAPAANVRARIDSALAAPPAAFAPGLVITLRDPAPDSAAAAWLAARTGAAVAGLVSQAAAICDDGTIGAGGTVSAVAHAVLAPAAGTSPLLRACAAPESILAVERASNPPAVACGAALLDLSADLRDAFLDRVAARAYPAVSGAILTAPAVTENTSGPYGVVLWAADPAGVDSASLALDYTAVDASGNSVTAETAFSPGPGHDRFTAQIPGQPAGSTITAHARGRTRSGADLAAIVPGALDATLHVVADSLPPVIDALQASSVSEGESLVIEARITDGDTGVDSASVVYDAGAGSSTAPMRPGGDVWRATLPPLPRGTRIGYRVTATDRALSPHAATSSLLTTSVRPAAGTIVLTDRPRVPPARAFVSALESPGPGVDLWSGADLGDGVDVALAEGYDAVVVLAGGAPETATRGTALERLHAGLGQGTRLLLAVSPEAAAADSTLRAFVRTTCGATIAAATAAQELRIANGADTTTIAVDDLTAPRAALVVDAGAPLAHPVGLWTGSRAASAIANATTRGVATIVLAVDAESLFSAASLATLTRALQAGADSSAAHPVSTEKLAFLPTRPDPATPPIAFRIIVPPDGGTHVDVYDARGRRIRRVADDLPGGVHVVMWDGRDERVRAVRSGVYWVVAERGSERATERIVLMRGAR